MFISSRRSVRTGSCLPSFTNSSQSKRVNSLHISGHSSDTLCMVLHKRKWGLFCTQKPTGKRTKKEAAGRWVAGKETIRLASLNITDLRKCHLLFQNETSPLAVTLRYTVNSIKTKWRCHLETQRAYFTLTIKILQSHCFVSELNLSKLTYPAKFFQFCRKRLCCRKQIIGFFVVVACYNLDILRFYCLPEGEKKKWDNTLFAFML